MGALLEPYQENFFEAAAVAFSLIQSCRFLQINPRDYLKDVMRRLLDHANKLCELLPDNWSKKTLHINSMITF